MEGTAAELNVRPNDPDASHLMCVTPDEMEMLSTLRSIRYGSLQVFRRDNTIDHWKMEITVKPTRAKA